MKKEKDTKRDEECKFCHKVHKGRISSHYNEGNSARVALIFSCPGQEEEEAKKAIFGKTGDNLILLLEELRKKEGFSEYNCRYDFRITNASDRIEYKKKTNTSESKDSFINNPENLRRLHCEIKDISEIIICFGKKAEKTMIKLHNNPLEYPLKDKIKIIPTKHLSFQSLNCIPNTKTTEERIQFVANDIKNKLTI
jgi:uracil-DNA glycosylase